MKKQLKRAAAVMMAASMTAGLVGCGGKQKADAPAADKAGTESKTADAGEFSYCMLTR